MQQHCSCKTALQRFKPFLVARQREQKTFDCQWQSQSFTFTLSDTIAAIRQRRRLRSLRLRVGVLLSALKSRIPTSNN
jgi:hypothetical protein